MAVEKNVNLNLTATDKATPVVQKLQKAITRLFGVIISGKYIGNAIKMSAEYETALNRLRLEMGKGAVAAEEYAQKVQELVGIDAKDWVNMQSTFATMANGMGVTSKQMEIMSQNLTQLSYDYASLFGDNVQNAADKVTAAMSGQVKGLKAYGNNVSSAAVQQTAYSRGITETISSLDSATQAQLRYITIMENANLAHVFNNMAQTIQSPANMLRVLSANLQVLQRSVGNAASAIFQTIYPALLGIVQAATAAANALARLFGYESFDASPFEDFGLDMEKAAEAAEDVGGGLGGGSKAAKEIAKYLAPFDELNIIPTEKDRNSGGGGGASSGAKRHYDLDLPSYDFLKGLREQSSFLGDFFEPLRNSWDKYGEYVVIAWESFYRTLKSSVKYISDAILSIDRQATFDSLVVNLGKVATLFDTFVQKLVDTDKKTGLLKSVFQDFDDIVRTLSETFGMAIDATTDWVRELNLAPLYTTIKWLSSEFSNFAQIVIKEVYQAYKKVLLPLAKFTIEKALPGIIAALSQAFKVFGSVLKTFSGYLRGLTPLLSAFLVPLMSNKLLSVLSRLIKKFALFAGGFKDLAKVVKLVTFAPLIKDTTEMNQVFQRGIPMFGTIQTLIGGLGKKWTDTAAKMSHTTTFLVDDFEEATQTAGSLGYKITQGAGNFATNFAANLAPLLGSIALVTGMLTAMQAEYDKQQQAFLNSYGYDELKFKIDAVTSSNESLRESMKSATQADSGYARAKQDLEMLRSTMVDGVIPATDANKKLVENINSYLGETVLTIDDQNNSILGVNDSLDKQLERVYQLAQAEVYYDGLAEANKNYKAAVDANADAQAAFNQMWDDTVERFPGYTQALEEGRISQDEFNRYIYNSEPALKTLQQAVDDSTAEVIDAKKNVDWYMDSLDDLGVATGDVANTTIEAWADWVVKTGSSLDDAKREFKIYDEDVLARLQESVNKRVALEEENAKKQAAIRGQVETSVKSFFGRTSAESESANAKMAEDAETASTNVQKSYGQMGAGMVGHYKLAGKSILGEGAAIKLGMSNYGTKTTEDYMKNMQREIVNRTAAIAAKARAMGARIWEQTKLGTGNGVSVANYFLGGFQGAINNPYSGFFGSLSRLGNRILNTFKSSLSINSPSKATYEIGKFFDEGLINGIDAYSSKAANAAADLGATVTSAMEGSLEPVSFDSMISMPSMDNIGDISASMVQALTANGTLNITVQSILDGKQIGQSVVEYNNGIVKRTGNSPLLV